LGLGKLMADGAEEFKLPLRQDGPGDAEVYFFTGSAYKTDRLPFIKTMLQNALAEAGCAYTEVDSQSENTPNAFKDYEYGIGPLHLATILPGGGPPSHFHTDEDEMFLIVAGTDVWLVKDALHATLGMPPAHLPAFPKLSAKRGTVRGVVEDGSGRRCAPHRLVQCGGRLPYVP